MSIYRPPTKPKYVEPAFTAEELRQLKTADKALSCREVYGVKPSGRTFRKDAYKRKGNT